MPVLPISDPAFRFFPVFIYFTNSGRQFQARCDQKSRQVYRSPAGSSLPIQLSNSTGKRCVVFWIFCYQVFFCVTLQYKDLKFHIQLSFVQQIMQNQLACIALVWVSVVSVTEPSVTLCTPRTEYHQPDVTEILDLLP